MIVAAGGAKLWRTWSYIGRRTAFRRVWPSPRSSFVPQFARVAAAPGRRTKSGRRSMPSVRRGRGGRRRRASDLPGAAVRIHTTWPQHRARAVRSATRWGPQGSLGSSMSGPTGSKSAPTPSGV